MEFFSYLVQCVTRLTYIRGLIRISNCARLSRLGVGCVGVMFCGMPLRVLSSLVIMFMKTKLNCVVAVCVLCLFLTLITVGSSAVYDCGISWS